MGYRGGLWTFVNEANNAKTTVNVGQDSSAGKIKAAFDTAKATLAPANNNTLVGIDPRGNKMRYTGVALGKKFDR